MLVWVFANQYGNMRVVYQVVAYRSNEGPSELTHTSAACNYQISIFFFSCFQ